MEKYRVYAGIDLDAVRYNMESMHNNINKDTKIVASRRMGMVMGHLRLQRQLKICHTYGDMLLLLQKKQKNYGSMDAKSLC